METDIALACIAASADLLLSSAWSTRPLLSSHPTDDKAAIYSAWQSKKHDRVKLTVDDYRYTRDILNRYTDIDFKEHFRMSRTSVEKLTIRLAAQLQKSNNIGRPCCDYRTKILVSLWAMANKECFRSIGDRFSVGRGHAHTIFIEFCKNVSSFANDEIKWPTGDEAVKIIHEFNQLNGDKSFPNVIGCIDVMHIEIPAPTQGKRDYYNRKSFHSVLLQAICSSDMKFTNVFTGWPGSSSDVGVWQRSDIGMAVETHPDSLFPQGSYLLGDCAYPLSAHLLIPYRDDGYLNEKQRHFNETLDSTRVVIDRTFGQLIARFRRLHYLQMRRLDLLSYVIMAACVLHNLCIDNGDEAYECANIERNHIVEGENFEQRPAEENGTMRNIICEFLWESEHYSTV